MELLKNGQQTMDLLVAVLELQSVFQMAIFMQEQLRGFQ
jgi:hypothetical protein